MTCAASVPGCRSYLGGDAYILAGEVSYLLLECACCESLLATRGCNCATVRIVKLWSNFCVPDASPKPSMLSAVLTFASSRRRRTAQLIHYGFLWGLQLHSKGQAVFCSCASVAVEGAGWSAASRNSVRWSLFRSASSSVSLSCRTKRERCAGHSRCKSRQTNEHMSGCHHSEVRRNVTDYNLCTSQPGSLSCTFDR